jgi:hypothetical protein
LMSNPNIASLERDRQPGCVLTIELDWWDFTNVRHVPVATKFRDAAK